MKDEMQNVLEEARMIIPGIQALFGFQTMAVFNERYESLPPSGVWTHLIGLGLLALAMALLMAPASYHRLAERGRITREMIELSSFLITAGMLPLMLAISLDIYVVVLAAIDDMRAAICGALASLLISAILWFIFPIVKLKSKRRK